MQSTATLYLSVTFFFLTEWRPSEKQAWETRPGVSFGRGSSEALLIRLLSRNSDGQVWRWGVGQSRRHRSGGNWHLTNLRSEPKSSWNVPKTDLSSLSIRSWGADKEQRRPRKGNHRSRRNSRECGVLGERGPAVKGLGWPGEASTERQSSNVTTR